MFQEAFVNRSQSIASSVGTSGLPLRVGLIGTGVVGSGTCEVLMRNAHLIAQRSGRPIQLIMAAARNLAKAACVVGPNVALQGDPFELVRHPDVDVVVEVMGGISPAKALILEAIAHGKHVVTANKALLAVHGDEIFEAADALGVTVAYEAAVAVSIPIVKVLREGLAANRIQSIAGVVNGTTNFILSQMQALGMSFEAALALASESGFAEADPSLDVDGIDAAHKTALLAAMAFGVRIPFDQLHVEGIRSLDPWDMACANTLGYRIKLLGIARRWSGAVDVRVHPALVPESHLLSQVQGSMNGIWVEGDASGPTFHYGAGAGSQTTASAIVADLIDLARVGNSQSAGVPHRSVVPAAICSLPLHPIGKVTCPHYLRYDLPDNAQDFYDFPERMSSCGMAIQHLIQRDHPGLACQRSWVFLTHPMTGESLDTALEALSTATHGIRPTTVLRVEAPVASSTSGPSTAR